MGFLVSSCEEDPTIIGENLLPKRDFISIESTDTIKPVSYTMYDASINTSNPSTAFLGTLKDPYFGTTTASFVTQLRLKEDWQGKSYVVDSVKLYLQFTTMKGSATGPHKLNFQEVSGRLKLDSAYYSDSEVPLGGYSATGIVLPALKPDSVNNVIIKLPDNKFAERILQDTSKLFHSNKIPDFTYYFKGLYFTLTSDNDPVMLSLSLVNTGDGYPIIDRYYNNFFEISYHDVDNNKHAYYLILDAINRNASFDKFSHDFTTADPSKMITHINKTAYRDPLTYLQALNGVYTRIVFPGLQAFKTATGHTDSISVNKARLTIPYFYDSLLYKNSDLPSRLILRYRTTTGEKPWVPDMGIDEYRSFFDGSIDTLAHVYNFNLATFVQQYLKDRSGKILPELEVVQASGLKNLILKANNNPTPVKFSFSYTRF
jgi:hypothetical protein